MSGDLTKEYQDIIDTTALVFKMDIYGKITYINEMFSKATKYNQDDLTTLEFNNIKQSTKTANYEDIWETLLSKESWHGVIKAIDKEDTPFYLRTTMYPILDMKDSIKDIMCIGYEITEEVMLERDKNKKIISTKTNFVQKTKDKEAIIQKELNDTKAQLEKAIEVVEYLKRQNSELIKKTNSNGYESEINRLIQENTELRKNLRASESKLKSQQLDMVRKEKVLNEKANNLYVKNVDLTGRNEKLQNDLKKSKTELQKLSNTINNNRKTLTIDTKLKDHLPTYRDRDKDVKMKGNALKAMFK